MSDDGESRKLGASILYFAGVLLTVTAVTLGVVLHWVAALVGPQRGLFGIDAWAGAFGSVVIVVVGIWAWQKGRQHLGIGLRRLGTVVAVVLFSAVMFGSSSILAASWQVVCSSERPAICFNLGVLLEDDDSQQVVANAYRAACRGGHNEGCARVIDAGESSDDFERACDIVVSECERILNCGSSEDSGDGCPSSPQFDLGRCEQLIDACNGDLLDSFGGLYGNTYDTMAGL